MRRILVLAYYFPPIAASGSLRPAGFCAHLPSLDYRPTVLSTQYRDVHPPIAIDESLEMLLDSSLDIQRVNHINWQKTLLTLRDKIARRGVSDGSQSVATTDQDGEVGQLGLLKQAKAAFLDRLFRFPDQQKAWAAATFRYARKLPTEKRPDIVLATASPWSALVAGSKIAEHYKVPFVADFRDPWTKNPKPALSPSLGRKAEVLEAEIFHKATRIIANTPELADEFRRQYPSNAKKVVTITNGFHQSLEEKFANLPSFQASSDKVELCYFGSVYELRRPTELLLALKNMLDAQFKGCERLMVRLTGNWIVEDQACNRLAEELEERGALIREPGVDHESYLNRLKASQILLILQQGFPLQIPGKIYEYIASGRPILVIGGEGATANLVHDAKLGMVCENSIAGITKTFTRLLGEQHSIQPPDPKSIGRFNYASLSTQLAETLDSAITEYHG